MNEIERTYYQDIAEKKKTANGAKHKASRGIHSITVHNQSDNLTDKEKRELSSEAIVFEDRPINKIEFCKMGQEAQKSYLKYIIQKYNVNDDELSKMLSFSRSAMHYRIKELDLSDLLTKHDLTEEEQVKWNEFLNRRKDYKNQRTKPDTTYMIKPMHKHEFYKLTKAERKEYLKHLLTTYNATGNKIAKMFDMNLSYLYKQIRGHGLGDLLNKRRRMSKEEEIRWDNFIGNDHSNATENLIPIPTYDVKPIIETTTKKDTKPITKTTTKKDTKPITNSISSLNFITLSANNKNVILDDVFKVLDMLPDNCRIDVSFKITKMEDE